jgi:hypothetical protein
MPAVVLATAIMPHNSLLGRDNDENSFVFQAPDADAATAAAAIDGAGLVQHFYNSANPHHPLAWYLSSVLSRAAFACTIEYYDITGHLDGSPHGSPVLTVNWTLGAGDPGAFNLPAHDAAVITTYGSGRAAAPVEGAVAAIPTDHRAQAEGAPATHSGRIRPKQRLTGRVYVGPLRENVLGYVLEETVLLDTFVSDMAAAAHRLGQESNAAGAVRPWSVWSRAGASVAAITGGNIDNRVDVQRRREIAATARLPWVA